MFVLATLKRAVEVPPSDFSHDLRTTIIDRLNEQFANYVVPEVGLFVTFYDFKKIGSSSIIPGGASSHTNVVFRYIVFQPIVGEIIEGIVAKSKSSREGLGISLQFFQDIIVESDSLPSVSRFDEVERIWYWEYKNDDGEITKFFMDDGKRVRFRVLSVDYRKVKPGDNSSALSIKATMADYGLGCISWWEQSEDVKQEDEEEGEEGDQIEVD